MTKYLQELLTFCFSNKLNGSLKNLTPFISEILLAKTFVD